MLGTASAGLPMLKWLVRFVAFVLIAIALLGVAAYTDMHLRESEEAKLIAPGTGRFIQTRDAWIFVQEAGPAGGAPVVLICGTGAWSELWRETIDALSSDGHRVVAIDMPPFGFSEKLREADAYSPQRQANRIQDVLDALRLKPVTLIAHSVDARPVLELVLRVPGYPSRLVLVNAALDLQLRHGGMSIPQNDASVLVRTVFAVTRVRDAFLAAYATNPMFTRSLFSTLASNKAAITDTRVEVLRQPLAVRGTTRAYGDWLHALMISPETALATDLSNFKKVSAPTLIVWGREDTLTPLAQGEALERLLPHSRLEVIDGAGHLPHIENTPAFLSALRGFLKPPAMPPDR